MSRLSLIFAFMMSVFGGTAFAAKAPVVDRVEPTCWFVGMGDPSLQLMVYGDNISSADVTVDYPGVQLSNIVRVESPNYLLVYLHLDKDVQAGELPITFTKGKKKTTISYVLKNRQRAPETRMGFDMSDVLYLLMPDRFANGQTDNDQLAEMSTYKVDREDPNARHGGDLKGIADHLDYFADLGVTALWFTPIMENSMEGGSYHGYATTNYYQVDPRFGTNEEYKKMIQSAHDKGLKIVMDMIFNHCGVEHPWIKDMPSKDWFNHSDYKKDFVQTSFKLTSHVDPYTSEYDFDQMNDGWFVSAMPDLNQRNPHVLKYLIQNSYWWIEEADIDGIRMDTHPYADYDAMSTWLGQLNKEYPNFNVVGETWVTEPAYTAWYQKDSKLSAPKNSNLKSVMDFSFFDKLSQAKNEQTDGWFSGLNKIYNSFVYDYLYPNPSMILAFIENHDTPRFLYDGQDFNKLKWASTLLLTTHRIPQLYYGTEFLMNGKKEKSDGEVRKDFIGGWASDARSWFNPEDRTPEEQECFNFFRTLLQWRKGNLAITKGGMKHFMPQNGIYVYSRQHEDSIVLVLLNGNDKDAMVPVSIYDEVIKDCKHAKDVTTGRVVDLTQDFKMAPREALVLELGK